MQKGKLPALFLLSESARASLSNVELVLKNLARPISYVKLWHVMIFP